MKIRAMNAHVGTVKDLENPNYVFETKFDGVRALCYVNKGLKFISRNDLDLTHRYPGLACRDKIHAKTAILDGEIVAFDKDGVSSFSLLQQGHQATYVIFDILMKNGKNLTHLPLLERKKILEKTVTNCARCVKDKVFINGNELWEKMRKRHAEGVMIKDKNAPYYPGRRSKVWLKLKFINTLDTVIVGYISGKRSISSLALGLYDGKKVLHYIGCVGTGFSDQLIADLLPKLKKLSTKKKPASTEDAKKGIHWVKPKLVAEVKYEEFTDYGMLRQSVLLRIRTDKKPKQCTFASQDLMQRD